jgi:hypothetical protein
MGYPLITTVLILPESDIGCANSDFASSRYSERHARHAALFAVIDCHHAAAPGSSSQGMTLILDNSSIGQGSATKSQMVHSNRRIIFGLLVSQMGKPTVE